MRAVVQRVSRAKVTVGGKLPGEIGRGFLVLLGVADGDTRKMPAIWPKKSRGCGCLRMPRAK